MYLVFVHAISVHIIFVNPTDLSNTAIKLLKTELNFTYYIVSLRPFRPQKIKKFLNV